MILGLYKFCEGVTQQQKHYKINLTFRNSRSRGYIIRWDPAEIIPINFALPLDE